MKHFKSIILLLVAFLLVPVQHIHAEEAESKELDIPEIVLEHLADAYEWHIASYEGKHLSVPLPIIVRSENTGEWHFCTAHTLPEPFFFSEEHHGKIYERVGGEEVRPIDLSITKTVAQIWIVVIVLITIFLSCARWYKRHDAHSEAPKGFVGAIESMVGWVYDDIIVANIPQNANRYAPYLLTAFFFIFLNNLIGLIPGSANITGNIAITFFLATCTFLMINLFGNKHYWLDIFNPHVPWWLKPIMIPIEILGMFTKPVALMIRLFANIMAGHTAMLALFSMIFITASMGAILNGSMTILAVLFTIFMNALELLVAFIQAYVFTMLSAIFIGLSQPVVHESEA